MSSFFLVLLSHEGTGVGMSKLQSSEGILNRNRRQGLIRESWISNFLYRPKSVRINWHLKWRSVRVMKRICFSVYLRYVDRPYGNNLRGISLLLTSHTSLCNIFLARLTPFVNKETGEQQHRFWRSKSTINHFLRMQMLKELLYGSSSLPLK